VRIWCVVIQSIKAALAEDDARDKFQPPPLTQPSASELRILSVGDYLYQEAEPRAYAYRVEKGVVAVFERRVDRPANIIEMAGRGDYVGLGCLEKHRDNARAVVDSIVRVLPRGDLALLAERDTTLRQRQDDAIERDFAYGRVLAHNRGRSAPLQCVAAFLAAVSRQNAHEGRDPTVVSDTLKCGTVTNLLDIDIRTLERALLKLRGMGLVEQSPSAGLHLKDIEALERIADGDPETVGITATDDMTGCAMEDPRPTRRNSSWRFPSGSKDSSYWKGVLREVSWVASLVGGLSLISVGMAILIAISLQ
jgi:CRP/FNR family transcriptional regulator, anaerobic regulatory protein